MKPLHYILLTCSVELLALVFMHLEYELTALANHRYRPSGHDISCQHTYADHPEVSPNGPFEALDVLDFVFHRQKKYADQSTLSNTITSWRLNPPEAAVQHLALSRIAVRNNLLTWISSSPCTRTGLKNGLPNPRTTALILRETHFVSISVAAR